MHLFIRTRVAGSLLLALAGGACNDGAEQSARDTEPDSSPAAGADCADPAIRVVVRRFGERLREVSLLGPDSVIEVEMRAAYGDLVTPELLDDWVTEPAAAPGREVSSPWPQRIEIAEIDPGEGGACVARGEVIYATSADSTGDRALGGEYVTLNLIHTEGWRIGAYEAAESPLPDTLTVDTATG
jgi:hypothetical protein